MCDRVGHTLIVSVHATTPDKISFLLTFGWGRPGGGANQRVARGSCKAVIEWGPAAAAARDDGMKLGSCPSLLHMRNVTKASGISETDSSVSRRRRRRR